MPPSGEYVGKFCSRCRCQWQQQQQQLAAADDSQTARAAAGVWTAGAS